METERNGTGIHRDMRKAEKYIVGLKKRRSESDGYAVVENMAVLPVVFLVIYALLFAGFILHTQCTIESAARRGVLYGGRLICDPQYGRVTARAADASQGELNEMSGSDWNFAYGSDISYQPYRYIPFLNGDYFGEVDRSVEDYVRKILSQGTTWMFRIDEGGVDCEAKNYVLSQNLTVKVTASYPLPKLFSWLGLPEAYELKAQAVMTVGDQDEFIRNVDYVADLAEKSGLTGKIKEAITKPLNKLREFTDKLFKR